MTELVNLNFKIVVPQAATNLITNPSFETNTTGWTVGGSNTIARSAIKQRRGAYGALCTYQDNAVLASYAVTLTDTPHIVGLDVYVPSTYDGTALTLTFTGFTSATVAAGTVNLTLKDKWQRVEATITPDSGDLSGTIVLTEAGSPTAAVFLYIDGAQLETGSEATTYFDGDSVGFVIDRNDFGWNGTRHGSTSYRTAKTRAGGSLLSISDYATLAGVYGLGMGSFKQSYTNIILGGATYEGHIRTPRAISLLLHYTGSMSDMWDDKNAIINAIRPDYTGDDQPLILRFQGTDSSGNIATEPIDIVCIPEMSHTDSPQTPALQEDILTFKVLESYLRGSYQEGVELDFADSLTNANCILMLNSSGRWEELSTGFAHVVMAIAQAANGDIYMGGAFTNAGGDADADYLCKWDGTALSAVVAGITGAVYALAFDSEGNLYIGGNFTNVGDANGDYVVKFDGTNFSSLGTGMNGTVNGLLFDSDGNLYACGGFTSAGGVANTSQIAKWNGTAWSALGSGANGTSHCITIDSVDNIYIGGEFTTVGGVTVNRVAKWNGTAWSALGSGANDTVYRLTVDKGSNLYCGGNFTTINGESIPYLAKWNGTAWSALGSGVNDYVRSLAVSLNGELFVGGSFKTAGGISLSEKIATYYNLSWEALSINFPGTPLVQFLYFDSDENLYVGFNTTGTATVAGEVAATNGGGSNCYPKVRVNGPGTLHKLTNNTTGAQITFNGLTLLTGEVFEIDFDPEILTVESSYRGDCQSYIAPGSDKAYFHLQKGDNSISFLMTGTDGDTEAAMYWTPTYWALDQTKYGA